jgi:hypothetical protein
MAGHLMGGSQIARADDDISLLGDDRLDEEVNLIRKVLPIAIQADHDLGFELARSAKAGVQGSALALIAFMANHGGTRGTSYLGGIVSGAIINDDHLAGKTARLEYYTADEARLIVGRDDDCQVRVRRKLSSQVMLRLLD